MNVEQDIAALKKDVALVKIALVNAEGWATKHALLACSLSFALGFLVCWAF